MRPIKRLRIKTILFLCMLIPVFSFSWTGRNLLDVYINSNDQIMVERSHIEIDSLKDIVKLFISNPNNDWENAEKRQRNIPLLGIVNVSKGIISIQCERNTTYSVYIRVQNELEKAFNELRNEYALKMFKTKYDKLGKNRRKAINAVIPKVISEAEPIYIRNAKGKLIRNTCNYWYW